MAKKRINYLFDEFEVVVVGFSGGKDSTVTLEVTLEIAKERGIEKTPVIFIDQEAEWQGTIDYVKEVMYRDDVIPYWFQMPMVITNNASSYERYSKCFDPEKEEDWIHPRDPIAITENKYGTERFHELFGAIFNVEFAGKKACYVAGVRTEEAPKRFVAVTEGMCYKWLTWGRKLKHKDHYTFYPLYDWSYTDIWKYIHDNDISYNKVYDELYRHGVSFREMRISNLHHETAIQSLMLVQEIEPDTWNRVAKRIDGANTIKHIQKNSFVCPSELPPMFEDWREYAYHLANNIPQDEKYRNSVIKKMKHYEEGYTKNEKIAYDYWRIFINTILSSDFDYTKFQNWYMSGPTDTYRRYNFNPQGENKEKFVWLRNMLKSTKYLEPLQIQELVNYFENAKN